MGLRWAWGSALFSLVSMPLFTAAPTIRPGLSVWSVLPEGIHWGVHFPSFHAQKFYAAQLTNCSASASIPSSQTHNSFVSTGLLCQQKVTSIPRSLNEPYLHSSFSIFTDSRYEDGDITQRTTVTLVFTNYLFSGSILGWFWLKMLKYFS